MCLNSNIIILKNNFNIAYKQDNYFIFIFYLLYIHIIYMYFYLLLLSNH